MVVRSQLVSAECPGGFDQEVLLFQTLHLVVEGAVDHHLLVVAGEVECHQHPEVVVEEEEQGHWQVVGVGEEVVAHFQLGVVVEVHLDMMEVVQEQQLVVVVAELTWVVLLLNVVVEEVHFWKVELFLLVEEVLVLVLVLCLEGVVEQTSKEEVEEDL